MVPSGAPTPGQFPVNTSISMILLLSTIWPERALLRAQLEADTGQRVVGTDSPEAAVEWLGIARFALLLLDTQAMAPDRRLLDMLRAHAIPLLLLTGNFGRTDWEAALAGLDVKAVLVRPLFIGDVTRAARQAINIGSQASSQHADRSEHGVDFLGGVDQPGGQTSVGGRIGCQRGDDPGGTQAIHYRLRR